MALRRALALLALILASLQAASGSVMVGCHKASRSAEVAGVSAEPMSCHEAVDVSTAPAASADALHAGLRAADCCAAHQLCAACNAPSIAAMRVRGDARQPNCVVALSDRSSDEVARDGRTLDHIPL